MKNDGAAREKNNAKSSTDLRHRVEAVGNKVNWLVFRCLTARTCSADYLDAFEGLCACCWLAKRNMNINGNAPETRAFIESELDRLLKKYRQAGRDQIAALALKGEFRHAARIVRNRMRDHIRKVYRELRSKRQEPPEAPSLEPTSHEMELVKAHLAKYQRTFQAALGWRNYGTLWAASHAWPLGRTKRERKKRVVAAIAALRSVSLQQARALKRTLVETIQESNNPLVIALRSSGWFRWAFIFRTKLSFRENPRE